MNSDRQAAPAVPGENRIIWAVAITQLIGVGVLFHSFTLFLKPLNAEFGWTAFQVTSAFTLALFVADVVAIPIGYLMDRRGGRVIMTMGAVIGAVALFSASRISNLTEFNLAFVAVGVAQSMLLGNIPASVIAANVRDYRRGLTYVAIIGGLSSAVAAPIVSVIINQHGWRAGMVALASILILGPGLICAFALRGTVGSRTEEFARRKMAISEGRLPSAAQGGTSPLRSALRTRAFWALTVAFSVHWYVMSGISVHLVPLLDERGLSTGLAVTIFALTGPAAVVGRLIMHFLDPMGSARRTGRLAFPIFACGMLILIFAGAFGAAGHFIFAFVHGAAGGVIMIVRQTVIAEIFGLRGYAAISGAMSTISILPRTMSPVTLALLRDGLGGYQPVLWFLFGLILLGTLAYFIGTSDRRRPAH
ncbi:MFS transporter [Roseiarcaceae bacterium H3SJ34-1]|uniref:MFS transporter n=1 Tax=Terripilifer ovatus TaxID=3032367 RepID=UPI003AB92686|nr:MFS transporter [Roseiarcaceae bacterium H3SJ34-1]